MKRMNLQIFEAAKDTGVTQRYQRADYIMLQEDLIPRNMSFSELV